MGVTTPPLKNLSPSVTKDRSVYGQLSIPPDTVSNLEMMLLVGRRPVGKDDGR